MLKSLAKIVNGIRIEMPSIEKIHNYAECVVVITPEAASVIVFNVELNITSDMEKRKMEITVDDREPKSMDIRAKIVGGMTFHRKRLKIGDYICGNVCIERKEINDLCASIMDNRLTSQIVKMKSEYEHIYILVSGSIKNRTSDIHEHCILGKIASILVKHKVPIVIVEDDFQLLYLMKRIFERHSDLKQLKGGNKK